MLSLNPIPSLPRYSGRYNVGSTEFEIPSSEIDPQSSPSDARISTIKFRLFYPTGLTSAKEAITWIPPPQNQWIHAFSVFLGTSLGWSSLINPILSVMSYITIPAIPNAPLRPGHRGKPYPLAIFSHGLAGNCNMYSAVCGSLASSGVVCVAIEHRDGSSPVSFIRGPRGKIETEIGYQKHPHTLTPDVFNARNAQLRIRLWELDLLYSALSKLDEGLTLSNYASDKDPASLPSLKSSMDFTPGHVAWLGHSFGAATITQLVKSIYYRKSLPSITSASTDKHDWTPLYNPSSESKLAQQITSSSPVALLDVWTLPFRAPSTQWLWEKPLPCYDRDPSSNLEPNTVAVMSTEFYNYTDLRKRTQALLSPDPVGAEKQLAQETKAASTSSPGSSPSSPTISTPPHKGDTPATAPEPDALPAPALTIDSSSSSPSPSPPSTRTPSPASSTHLFPPSPSAPRTPSPSSSRTSLSIQENPHTPPPPQTLAPKLFYIPSSAHLSQSDFGLLFPTLTRVLMKAIDPQGAIVLNIRAILAIMRSAGLDVRRIDAPQRAKKGGVGWFAGWTGGGEADGGDDDESEDDEEQDTILIGGGGGGSGGSNGIEGTGGRWVEIPLVF